MHLNYQIYHMHMMHWNHISTQRTMEFHHDKHHNTYVTKLNATVEKTLEHQSLADMIANLDKVPEAMRM